MITNRIVDIAITVLSFITLPLQVITTFVLGILVRITFGLLLFPISLIWTVLFLAPLLGLSWTWQRLPFARPLASLLGIPFAVAGETFCCLMPSMGEMESRVQKILLCQTFPYTWQCWQFEVKGLRVDSTDELYGIFRRCSVDIGIRNYLNSLFADATKAESQVVLAMDETTVEKP